MEASSHGGGGDGGEQRVYSIRSTNHAEVEICTKEEEGTELYSSRSSKTQATQTSTLRIHLVEAKFCYIAETAFFSSQKLYLQTAPTIATDDVCTTAAPTFFCLMADDGKWE